LIAVYVDVHQRVAAAVTGAIPLVYIVSRLALDPEQTSL
jgi:hypothetical protein